MCPRHGRGANGSSKDGVPAGGIKCTCGLKGKVKNWATKEMKEKSKPRKESFKADAISRSQGLIIKGQIEIHCPFNCNIRKYLKSMNFHLKNRDREIFESSAAPSNWERAKKTTTVDVQMNIPLNHVFDKLEDIYQTIKDGILNCSFEWVITFSFPLIGRFKLSMAMDVNLKVSDVLEKCMSFISKQNNQYYVCRILLDLYERQDVSQELLENCLSQMTSEKETKGYYVARIALDIYEDKKVSPEVLGKLLSELFTSQKETGVYVAQIVIDLYEGKDVSLDMVDGLLKIIFKSSPKVYEVIHLGLQVSEGKKNLNELWDKFKSLFGN